MNSLQSIIESNIFAIITAVSSFFAALSVMKHKIKDLEDKVRAIDDIKIEVKLAKIETDIAYIRKTLESGNGGGG